MRISKGCAVSLGLNVLLLAWLVVPGIAPAIRRGDGAVSRAKRTMAARPGAFPSATLPAGAVPAPVTIGGDWRSWLEPLRRAGVPTPVLVTLVREDFERRWQSKQEEVQREYRHGRIDPDGLALAVLQHDAKLQEEIRSALGEEAYRRWDMNGVLQGFNLDAVSLSDAERGVVYDLQCRWRESTRSAQVDRLEGRIDQATLESRQQVAEEEVAQGFRALLGDRRAAMLQGDDATEEVTRSLGNVPVSDAQLQELADLQRQWDKTRSDLTALETSTQDTKYVAGLQDAQEKWRADVQRILGADGLERYRRAQDSRYVEMRQFAPDWNLSPAEVDRVYDTFANFDDAVCEYSRDARRRDVDPLSLTMVVKQFAQQTEQSLQAALGPQRYELLRRNGVVLQSTP